MKVGVQNLSKHRRAKIQWNVGSKKAFHRCIYSASVQFIIFSCCWWSLQRKVQRSCWYQQQKTGELHFRRTYILQSDMSICFSTVIFNTLLICPEPKEIRLVFPSFTSHYCPYPAIRWQDSSWCWVFQYYHSKYSLRGITDHALLLYFIVNITDSILSALLVSFSFHIRRLMKGKFPFNRYYKQYLSPTKMHAEKIQMRSETLLQRFSGLKT